MDENSSLFYYYISINLNSSHLYFHQLLNLLNTEWEEDQQLYKQFASSSSVTERRSAGLLWYPVAIRETEIGRGDYLDVEIERTGQQHIIHQFRSGSAVALFSNHNSGTDSIEGVISYLGQNTIKVSFRVDELPEWTRNGKLGVDLLFDNKSYREMEGALKAAMKIPETDRAYKLMQVLLGNSSPVNNVNSTAFSVENLNEVQHAALTEILQRNYLSIIHGPPGTGKTTTLIHSIKALIAHDKHQVLVVAPSNTAVDLLAEKIAEQGLKVVRVGNISRISEKLQAISLDEQIASHPAMKEVRNFRKQANAYRDMAHKYKRNFGRSEREQRKALFNEAHKILKTVYDTEQYIIDDIISKADIIATTLVSANHFSIKHLKYKTLVIDEAGQAIEPACWIPILKADRLIMAGDHLQLPPTVKSAEAAKNGLNNTLFEKSIVNHSSVVTMLEEQYRMNELIMGFCSRVFYKGKLKTHASVMDNVMFSGDLPIEFIDTAGCGFDEKEEGTSISNPEEAGFLLKYFKQYCRQLPNVDYVPTVAIISPYKQQVELLKDLIKNDDITSLPLFPNISVNTIDGFQGQERDIVFISLTRSNPTGSIGFLADVRRMNVAITRAKKKLVIIGDGATLSNAVFYTELMAYAETHQAYKSAWEYMDDF
jgi:ATP-dependent RNA/DNA helicase IGHMBP2